MVAIRPASPTDASVLAALLGQLGYPADPQEIPGRLKALQGHPGAGAFVAELDGKVMGVVTAHVMPTIHATPPYALLTALVVSDAARGKGVGKALVEFAEDWVALRGAQRIAVTSALHREGAHAFYESLGYERTGVRLAKMLRPK